MLPETGSFTPSGYFRKNLPDFGSIPQPFTN